MRKYDAISVIQVSLLIITAIGLKNHVTVIPHLLGASKRDGWLTVLVALFIICCWSLLLVYLHKATRPNNIFDWLEQKAGKKVKWLISIPTSLVFVILTAETIKELIAWTKVTYLPDTPSFVTVTLFVAACAALVLTSFQTMSIVNTFVLLIVLVLGFFVAFANIQYKDFSLLMPVLENGLNPVLNGIIYPLSGHIEIISLLFIQHRIHKKLSIKVFLINLILLSWLTLGPFIGAIIEFGPTEAARTRFPAYEQWGLVSIGRFIEHVDFLSIYQWVTGAFIRVAFLLYLALEVLAIKDKQKKRIVLYVYAVIVIGLNLTPVSDTSIHYIIRDYTLPVNFWYFFSLSILLTVIVFVANRTKRRNSYVQSNKNTTNIE